MAQVTCTVNTDASYYPETGAGGFAFWIVADGFKAKRWGKFAAQPGNSTQAEFWAIINALTVLQASSLRPDVVFINTDCMTAVNCIRKRKSLSSSLMNESIMMLGLCSKFKKVVARHVKAHSGTGTARQWVNNWCDEMAKQGALS